MVALFSPVAVLEEVSDWTHEQLHEQLQVLPPLIALACLALISLILFSFFMVGVAWERPMAA